MDKLYVLVKEQFPEFVQADYPKFIEFVQDYYKWLEQELPDDIKKIVDIDNTPENYFDYFVRQLDVYGILNNTTPYIKKYIKNIKEIYTTKGSEQSFLFLLKAVYNADVSIDHPIEYVLKPSDGRWIKESFITLQTFFGDLSTISEWDFSYDCRCAGRDQILPVTRTEIIDQETVRIYYRETNSVTIFVDQRINIFNSLGDLVFVGTVIPSPARIEVLRPGRSWRVGEVIVWPSPQQNTIVRVSGVTPTGGILRAELVSAGFDHTDNEVYILSPFPIKPIGEAVEIDQIQTSITPPIFEYTLSINDQTDITDDVRGHVSGLNFNPYYLQDYQEENYNGQLTFNNKTFIDVPVIGQAGVSLEEWFNSRATLQYAFGPIGSLRGVWGDESGHISTDSIRLQDSFYYQQFSYVIESEINPSAYEDLAAAIHLAGTKQFRKFTATTSLKFNPQLFVSSPFIFIDILDVTSTSDLISKVPLIEPDDSVTSTDVLTRKSLGKALTSLAEPDDDDLSRTVTKQLLDSSLIQDEDAKSVVKSSVDSVVLEDVAAKQSIISRGLESSAIVGDDIFTQAIKLQKVISDVDAAEVLAKQINKTLTSSVTIQDTQFNIEIGTKYIIDDVFVQEVVSKQHFKPFDSNATVADDITLRRFREFEFDSNVTIEDNITLKQLNKPLASSVGVSDTTVKIGAKYNTDDVSAQENAVKQQSKQFESNVTADSLDTSSTQIFVYFDEAEDYITPQQTYVEKTFSLTVPE